ncbi:Ankyrin repeat protein 1 [Giardia muris]|uniref:Ankyrin repeat protein 1 n=1 Tax=Giardia muris TaxID=5742 RepID=A0A4Z1SYI7_GIAMU|nr:Ankyrin repeat protein 1 [Giardia muris]|eukprot:TNJ26733.1 Ankyrin repeat protein 1 [Giardia muris]
MIESPADWFVAVVSGAEDDVHQALERYAGTRDEMGDTALMAAARIGDVAIAQMLIPREVGCVNNEGCTALIAAAMSNRPETCALLVDFEKHIVLADGRDALMLAAFMGNLEAVRVLAERMTLVDDQNQMNALDYAVVHGTLDVVRAIVQSQPDIQSKLEYAIFLASDPLNEPIHRYLQQCRCIAENITLSQSACAQCAAYRATVASVETRLQVMNEECQALFSVAQKLRTARLQAIEFVRSSNVPMAFPSPPSHRDPPTSIAEVCAELDLSAEKLLEISKLSVSNVSGCQTTDASSQKDLFDPGLGLSVTASRDADLAALKLALDVNSKLEPKGATVDATTDAALAAKDAEIARLKREVARLESQRSDEVNRLKNEADKQVNSFRTLMDQKDRTITGLVSTVQKQQRSFSAMQNALQQKEVETMKFRSAILASEATVKNLVAANDMERSRLSARSSMVMTPLRFSGANWNWAQALPPEGEGVEAVDLALSKSFGSPRTSRNSGRLRPLSKLDNDQEKAELRRSIRLKVEENKMLKEALLNTGSSNAETKVLRDELVRLRAELADLRK